MTGVVLALVGIGLCLSCGKKKEQEEEIIIQPVVQQSSDEVRHVAKADVNGDVKWVSGNMYSYNISYASLDSVVVENYGVKYYDNVVNITVKRSDGSVVCTKTVQKSSFSGLLSEEHKAHGVLCSVIFAQADPDYLHFVATVGSPDETNEDGESFQYSIDRNGATSVARFIPRENVPDHDEE